MRPMVVSAGRPAMGDCAHFRVSRAAARVGRAVPDDAGVPALSSGRCRSPRPCASRSSCSRRARRSSPESPRRPRPARAGWPPRYRAAAGTPEADAPASAARKAPTMPPQNLSGTSTEKCQRAEARRPRPREPTTISVAPMSSAISPSWFATPPILRRSSASTVGGRASFARWRISWTRLLLRWRARSRCDFEFNGGTSSRTWVSTTRAPRSAASSPPIRATRSALRCSTPMTIVGAKVHPFDVVPGSWQVRRHSRMGRKPISGSARTYRPPRYGAPECVVVPIGKARPLQRSLADAVRQTTPGAHAVATALPATRRRRVRLEHRG